MEENLRKKLISGKEQAILAKKLATIVTDVPVRLSLKGCQLGGLDKPEVFRLFESLEFKSLIPRLATQRTQKKTESTEKDEQMSLL